MRSGQQWWVGKGQGWLRTERWGRGVNGPGPLRPRCAQMCQHSSNVKCQMPQPHLPEAVSINTTLNCSCTGRHMHFGRLGVPGAREGPGGVGWLVGGH